MKADPFCAAVYVFRAQGADRVKLIYWDGNTNNVTHAAVRQSAVLR